MKNNETTVVTKGGIGFFGALCLVLLVLKATGYLNISWFWVFAPLFIPFGIFVVFMVAAVLVILVLALAGFFK